MDTHGNDLYYCGLICELPLLLWILMLRGSSFVDTHVYLSTIVDTYGNGLYYCGYARECPPVLCLRMEMTFTIADTHGNGL